MNVTTKSEKSGEFDSAFLKQVLIVLLAAAGLGYVPVSMYAAAHVAEGVVAGFSLSVVNVLLGVVIVHVAMNASHTVFMQIAMAGIVVRLFVMLGLLLLCIVALNIDPISLIASLFVMYVIFLILEVMYIHKKIQR